MRKITKILGLGAAIAVAGTVGWHAVAQTPMGSGSHGPGMGMGMMMGGMTGGHGPMTGRHSEPAALLAAAKTELGITAQQQPAWDAYAKVLEDTGGSMKAQHQGMDMTAMHSMSSPDRQTLMTQMRTQHETAFQAVKAAADKLLPALDDAQKAKAKDILPGLAEHGPGMMRHAEMGAQGAPHGGATR